MIKNGQKVEEYQKLKPYWRSRINPKKSPNEVLFVNGYGKDRPSLLMECLWVDIGKGNPAWGAPQKKCFKIHLGDRIGK